jgi:ABC-type multidrug transport system fused ATPase/permease subunit
VLGIVSGTLNDISQIVSEVLNIRLVISRIQSFLNEEELDTTKLLTNDKLFESSSQLGFVNAEFQYYATKPKPESPKKGKAKKEEATPLLNEDVLNNEHVFQLNNIDLSFPIGQLTCIVGPTGSGKTSLLLALLGGIIFTLFKQKYRNETNSWTTAFT